MNNKGLIGAASAAALLLVGCGGGGSGVFNQPLPRAKAVNGVTGITSLNVDERANVIAASLAYGTASSPYTILDHGTDTINFYDSANTANPLIANGLTQKFSYGERNDFVTYGNTGAGVKVIPLGDNTANASAGSYRIVNATVTTASLDVFFEPSVDALQGPSNIVSGGVVNGTGNPANLTSYASAGITAATNYTLTVCPAGHDATTLATDSLILNPTDRYTFVVVDPPTVEGNYSIVAVQDNNAQ